MAIDANNAQLIYRKMDCIYFHRYFHGYFCPSRNKACYALRMALDFWLNKCIAYFHVTRCRWIYQWISLKFKHIYDWFANMGRSQINLFLQKKLFHWIFTHSFKVEHHLFLIFSTFISCFQAKQRCIKFVRRLTNIGGHSPNQKFHSSRAFDHRTCTNRRQNIKCWKTYGKIRGKLAVEQEVQQLCWKQ